MANRIDLIRHPDKEGDAEGVYLGSTAQITQKGWQEAEIVLQRLMRLPHELIGCSKMERTLALARMYAERLGYKEIDETPLYNEIDKPEFLVGLRRSDPRHVRIMARVRELFDDNLVPDRAFVEEVWKDFDDRPVPSEIRFKTRSEVETETGSAFARFEAYRCETALIVTHAKRIASYIHWIWANGTLKGYYDQSDFNLIFNTTGITTLVRKPHRRTGEMCWHVESVNDTSHNEEASTRELHILLEKLP